ncbi:MAG: hypothetical protein ACRCT1_02020 [Microcoleaceae cyanobacterium]
MGNWEVAFFLLPSSFFLLPSSFFLCAFVPLWFITYSLFLTFLV